MDKEDLTHWKQGLGVTLHPCVANGGQDMAVVFAGEWEKGEREGTSYREN